MRKILFTSLIVISCTNAWSSPRSWYVDKILDEHLKKTNNPTLIKLANQGETHKIIGKKFNETLESLKQIQQDYQALQQDYQALQKDHQDLQEDHLALQKKYQKKQSNITSMIR